MPNNLDEANQPNIEEIEIVCEEVNTTKSIKTNYLLINRNFKKLEIFLEKLIDFVKYVADSIKPEVIIEQVIEQINKNKLNLIIRPDLAQDSSVIVDGYIIERTEQDKFLITRQNNPTDWVTDNVIISVKEEQTGIVIYPAITTINNSVEVYFINGIYTNMKVIIL